MDEQTIFEILGIDDFNYRENSYEINDSKYTVIDLIELSKKYESFELPIAGLDIGIAPWGNLNIKQFIYHVKRMNEADLNYPIILDNTGFICDGWHRLAKAILKGRKTIKAIRLPIMPDNK